MKIKMTLLLFFSLTIFCYGQPKPSDVLEIKFKKIRDDIYVAYRPDTLKYWVEGNVTIIINDADVVVVDGSGTTTTAQKVITEIRRLTNKPVRYLINTHGHGDHMLGNQEYLKEFPGVEIIAHEKTLEHIRNIGYKNVFEVAQDTASRKKIGEAEIARLMAESKPENQPVIDNLAQYYRHDIDIRQTEYRKLIKTLPTLAVTKSMRLYRGSRTIEILHLGAGDTQGDLVVYLPQERIICIGDMVTEPVPFGYSQYPLEWIETLNKVSKLEFDTLIPGHGEIQAGKTYLRNVVNLLQSVQNQVRAGISEGLSLEAVRKKVDLSNFEKEFAGNDAVNRYYFQEYFVTPNVERTFNQIKLLANQK